MRRVESDGGFATIIRKGDPERGALILLVAERGQPKALLERRMAQDFHYRWAIMATADDADPERFHDSTRKYSGIDPDCWLIELDVADAERFIAETIASP